MVALHAECGDLTATATTSGPQQYQNPYNRNGDTGPCDFDLRHNFTSSLVYEAPKFSNRAVNEIAGSLAIRRPVLGAHRTSLHADHRSGQFADRCPPGPAGRGRQSVREQYQFADLDRSGGVRAERSGHFRKRGLQFADRARLSSIWTRTLRAASRFASTRRFDLRFEFFNLLNHTNFNPPVSSRSSSTFGRIQSAGDPRILQFAAKFVF